VAESPIEYSADQKESKGAIEKELLESRVILLSGTIDDRQAHTVVGQLLVLDQRAPEEPITLIINSGGGAISSGFAIYDTIQILRAPVRTIGAGLIASMGVTIFLAAKQENRYSLANSRYMIHQPLISGTVVAPASDVEINAREMIKLRDQLNALIAESSGQPLSRVETDTQRDYWMAADEAKAYGIVGEVIGHWTDLK
jgi:ATP-dependent Clp protease, protease subunit